MRHIDCDPEDLDEQWLEKTASLLQQLKNSPDKQARDQIIDDNRKVYRELKGWLLERSHQKCWFSEAKDCFSHWDVEHFRPKKVAKDEDGTEHEGYWWLSFDWSNLRICGNVGNRKKGTFFPLRRNCRRCDLDDDIRNEIPKLLDPVDEHDPTLLSFDLEGQAIPAANVSNEWERERVKYSVNRFNLDFPQLTNRRKVYWSECWGQILKYRSELAKYHRDPDNPFARVGIKDAAKAIRKMIRPESELSAVARACVLASGDQCIIRLLQGT